MSRKVFKKPSRMKQTFGVDHDGRNGLSSFAHQWASQTKQVLTQHKSHEMSWSQTFKIMAVIGGGAIYGASQLYEHNMLNVRPEFPTTQHIDIEADYTASYVTILPDPEREIQNFGASNYGEKSYLLLQNQNTGNFEISSCAEGSQICTPLSADDVRELNAEFRAMAEEAETEYLSPAFFFPHKIDYVSSPFVVQQAENDMFGEGFYHNGDLTRQASSDVFNVDGQEQRLNSTYMNFDVEDITTLWQTALNAPNAGTYSTPTISEDAYIWPRTETGEWQDIPTGENALLTVLGTYAFLSSLIAAGQLRPAARRAKENTQPLKGLNMLKK